eukprot:TRINITY_DN9197_c0_g1_i1.p2 TRINITY_DN9197_c0_g1~~TRINITY_DN9197_c0_g1_i1.p2  ORF type:complete len:169 (+),score=56.01 TRINITY_DN9197_c0_g1_i1:54-560(+)
MLRTVFGKATTARMLVHGARATAARAPAAAMSRTISTSLFTHRTAAASLARALCSGAAAGKPAGPTVLADGTESLAGHLSGPATVAYFTATWCPPCRAIGPVYDALAQEHGSKVTFLKIDVDACPGAAQEQMVQAMPTFVGFKGEKRVAEVVGADKTALEGLVQNLAK